MQRWLMVAVGMLVLTAGTSVPAAAQQASPAASAEILPALGYPELTVRVTAAGAEASASEVAAGRHLVTLEASSDVAAYLNVVRVPPGLARGEAEAQMLAAARDDLPTEGWRYAGGNYAFEGGSVRFVLDLPPGDWHLAASRQAGEEGEEIMQLLPLRVTGAATPAATPSTPSAAGDPEATATVELRDVAFAGLDAPLPAGPQVWRVANAGERPRQVVLFRTPRPVAAEEIQDAVSGLMTGTPPADGSLFTELVWVGYAALQSPGQTTWVEYDLEPGSYVATSWVIDDPATGEPALLKGMVQPFEVA